MDTSQATQPGIVDNALRAALKASEDQVHALRTSVEAEQRRSDMLLSEERHRTERAHALERVSWQTIVSLREQLLKASEHEQRSTHTVSVLGSNLEEDARRKQLEDEVEQTRRKLRLSDLKLADVTREKMDAVKALNDTQYVFSLAEQEWDEANRKALQERDGARHAQSIAEQEWDMAVDEARQERTMKVEAEKRAAALATAKDAVDGRLLRERARSEAALKNERKRSEGALARAKKKSEAALTTQRRRADTAQAALEAAKKKEAELYRPHGNTVGSTSSGTGAAERTRSSTALETEKRRSQAALAKERERTETVANALTATEQALAEIRAELQASRENADREKQRADAAIAALAAARERADAAERALEARPHRQVKEEVVTMGRADTVNMEEDAGARAR